MEVTEKNRVMPQAMNAAALLHLCRSIRYCLAFFSLFIPASVIRG